ncbi:MAG: hypothetical protein WEB56_11680 [Roseovarius sp.]
MAFSDDLTTAHVPLHALRPGLRLRPLESRGGKLTDEEIDHVIARTLAEDRQIEARHALPAIASQEEISGVAGRITRRAARQEGAAAARLDAVAARHPVHNKAHGGPDIRPSTSAPPVEDLTKSRGRRLPRLGARPRRIAFALGVVALVWTWPGLVLAALFASLLLVPSFIVALGSTAVSGALIRLFYWRHARSPERAERMRARLDRLAMRIDIVLDRLPEGWTQGLYMADFSNEALLGDLDDAAPDPFERLRSEAARN